jgi:hypothetical protein
MERIRALIGSGDYHGAKKLKSENDQLRQEWNTAVNARFLSPLGRLEDCQSAGYQTPAVDPDAQENCNSLPSRDCLLDFFYDLADEKQVSQTDYVQNPRSLHFAFRNAGLTLDKIFRSEWGDCRQLMNDHLLRQLYRCKQATTPDTEHDLEDQITCLAKARDQNQKDLLSCKNRKGSELQKQLREELNCVRERWTPLHNRFYRLEKRMEAGG